jgi:hypothetical protein
MVNEMRVMRVTHQLTGMDCDAPSIGSIEVLNGLAKALDEGN